MNHFPAILVFPLKISLRAGGASQGVNLPRRSGKANRFLARFEAVLSSSTYITSAGRISRLRCAALEMTTLGSELED